MLQNQDLRMHQLMVFNLQIIQLYLNLDKMPQRLFLGFTIIRLKEILSLNWDKISLKNLKIGMKLRLIVKISLESKEMTNK